jgi:hypothetical protein
VGANHHPGGVAKHELDLAAESSLDGVAGKDRTPRIERAIA